MKIAKSCVQCRTAKRKCTSERGTSCQQCVRKGKDCSLSDTPRDPGRMFPDNPSTVEAHWLFDDVLIDNITDETRDHLVDLYFRFIHDKPHTLFHPTHLRKRIKEEEIGIALLYGIMALAARFSDQDEVRHMTKSLFLTTKHLTKQQIERVCLDNIHACILVGNLCGAEGEIEAEAIFFGVAFRMADICGFPDAHDSADSMTQEVIIRTWCSLYMIDQWSSAGLDLSRQIRDEVKRPMDEKRFWRLKLGEFVTPCIRAKPKPSLWGHMVDLVQIFGRIKDFHQQLAEGLMGELETKLTTCRLKDRFDEFTRLRLPLGHHYNPRSLKSHAAAGLGGTFVALHLGYHHYATLLYFPYLDPQLAQIPGRSTYVDLCKSHAASFSDLLKTSHETPNCEAVYLIVAHMTVVSSSVLLHTLLFGEEDELSEARRRLYSNFEILLKLKQYWPGADLMVTRLFTFQKVCMRSMDRTYAVDRWIVKFLLQHALPIGDEVATHAPPDLTERGKVANDALSMLRPVLFQEQYMNIASAGGS